MKVEVFFEAAASLGEGPRWSAATGELHWVDIERGEIHRVRADGRGHAMVAVGRSVGAAVPRSNGDGWIAGLRDGVAVIGRDGVLQRFVAVDADRPSHRMNDGACDPAGRFWTGTLNEDSGPFSDALYRVTTDLDVTVAVTDVGLSNGLGWSPDGRAMYRVDSARGVIFRCDFDPASGDRGAESVFATVAPTDGEPDGLTVDAEGFVWVAIWDGWQLRRYASDGTVERVIAVPVARPTSCVFGGEDLATLFVTSARTGLSDDALARQPAAGHVLCCRPGVRGLPTNLFGA